MQMRTQRAQTLHHIAQVEFSVTCIKTAFKHGDSSKQKLWRSPHLQILSQPQITTLKPGGSLSAARRGVVRS